MQNLITNKQNESYKRAKQRVKALKVFYYNVIMYSLIIPVLAYINYKTSWEIKWVLFSAIGWGIGISIHAYRVYAKHPIFGHAWEQRKIQQFVKQQQLN